MTSLKTEESVFIQFYEVHGKKCYDLMEGRKNLRILSDKDEKVHALGANVVGKKLSRPYKALL